MARPYTIRAYGAAAPLPASPCWVRSRTPCPSGGAGEGPGTSRGRGETRFPHSPAGWGRGETRFPHTPLREPMFTLAAHAAPSHNTAMNMAWERGRPARVASPRARCLPPSPALPPLGGGSPAPPPSGERSGGGLQRRMRIGEQPMFTLEGQTGATLPIKPRHRLRRRCGLTSPAPGAPGHAPARRSAIRAPAGSLATPGR